MRSDHIKLVDYLDNYDIKVGDTVYILVWPNSSCSQYNYKKAELVFIKKDTFEGEKPKEGSKHYKAKIKMWERRYNKDECDRCKFVVQVEGDRYCREVERKYLYMQSELSILEEDITNLNKVYDFKKQQEKELQEYLTANFKDWHYNSFEERRYKNAFKRENMS